VFSFFPRADPPPSSFISRKASARDSSGSSVSYIDSGSESGSDDDGLPDPADLLKTLSSKVIKVENALSTTSLRRHLPRR
jgi:hypothetical protein